jgi:D-2-hydroxyacid dehydrogenase (NADP+)
MSTVERIGVHPSVDAFDPETLVADLEDLDWEVAVVEDNVEAFDAVVTLGHDDAFLDPSVEWVHFISAGVDHVPLSAYADHDVAVTNSSGVHGVCMAENVVGLMTTLAHRLTVFGEDQRNHEWDPEPAWTEKFMLQGEPVTVVGLGAIGRTVAEYVNRLGMRVSGVKRTPDPFEFAETVYASEDLEEAITDARFVVLTLPLSEETRDTIADAQLAQMRDDAYLVNVSRGGVVDEAALVGALREDQIAGAALDVFEEEPLPPESPLWEMDDVVVTPHVSGAFSTYHREIADLVRENVDNLDAGVELRNRVA